MRTRSMALIVPLMLIAALSVVPRAHADEWHKTYNVSGKATVHLETNDGTVRVSTWDGKQIDVRIETVGWKISDSEVRISERQTGDRWQHIWRRAVWDGSAHNKHVDPSCWDV